MRRYSSISRHRAALVALIATVLLTIVTAGILRAHEGHDHGPSPTVMTDGRVSAAAASKRFEIVAVLRGEDVIVDVDGLADNAPITGGKVSVASGGNAAAATETSPGTYTAHAPWLKAPGEHQASITVTAAGQQDGITTVLTVPADRPSAADGPPVTAGAAAPPHRHPDGAVFLGKPTQRLLGIRTAAATETTAAASQELTGRIIADPNASGRVQAVRDGVIAPPETGFPHLGQSVTRGELLATLTPTLSAFEEASLRQTLAQIERDMSALVPRADAIGIVNPNMPQSDATVGLLQELQIQSQALTRQKEVVTATLAARIDIKSPAAGVIASTNVVAGQAVAARDTLFEIVDPSRAWVEGFAFDPQPDDIAGATALTEDGRQLTLAFLGRGRILQQQATPLMFRVVEGGGIDIGTPVRIFATDQRRLKGIRVPRAAVVRGPGNLAVVWEHSTAETFVPRTVIVTPLDAADVLVTGEVAAGMRLVTAGASFISQVR